MKLNLHITYTDATEKTVEAVAREFVAFEDRFNMPIAKLDQDPKLTYFYFMAWHVESRTKATELTFEDWLETIDSVEVVDTKK
jgi:hypothetical protein